MFKLRKSKEDNYKAIAINEGLEVAAPNKDRSSRGLKVIKDSMYRGWPVHEILAAKLIAEDSTVIAAVVYEHYKNRRDIDSRTILAMVMNIAAQGRVKRLREGSKAYNDKLEALIQEDDSVDYKAWIVTAVVVVVTLAVVASFVWKMTGH